MDTTTITARWVFPVDGPPLGHGTVTTRGDRIEAVEPHGTCTPDTDLGNVAIIPGLVNAHTHLDLSGARGKIPPTDPGHFTDWLRGVIAFRRSRTPEQVREDVHEGLKECLAAGTTAIGNICGGVDPGDVVQEYPIRSLEFEEYIGLREEQALRWWEPHRVWFGHDGGRDWRHGISLHAPYSVASVLFTAMAEGVIEKRLPVALAVHLAESVSELELLRTRTGPFVDFLSQLGVWHPNALSPSVEWVVEQSRCQSGPVLFIHCNYLPPDTPFAPNQSVVYCPRTHAAFGHPPHPFREFLARGVRVCLGTDSLASNPDLDILAEARFLHTRYPDLLGADLLRMVTLSGSEALGWADETGSLKPGKSADLVTVPLPTRDAEDPHDLLFASDISIGHRRTMFRGQWR